MKSNLEAEPTTPEKMLNTIICGDCLEVMKTLPDKCVDLTVTSPPYDNLRTYNGFSFDFEPIARELYRVTKDGGVVVWVVGDSTKDGSESGTSFRQALYFKEVGFNLHDTMIYIKENYAPLTHNRYEQAFEYMFAFSKGRPKTFNPIKEKSKWGGTSTFGKPSYYKTTDGKLTQKDKMMIGEYKIKSNLWTYKTGTMSETSKYDHPAMYPLKLAKEQIMSWSSKDDIVLDPFVGAGTTTVACKDLNRNYIGIEISPEYCKIAEERLRQGVLL
jgi:DNA modification methylase